MTKHQHNINEGVDEGEHSLKESHEQIHKISIIWKHVQNLKKDIRYDLLYINQGVDDGEHGLE